MFDINSIAVLAMPDRYDDQYTNFKEKIQQIIPAPSTVQKYGGYKPKEAVRFRRLRNLKEIFSCFLNLIWYNLSTQSPVDGDDMI